MIESLAAMKILCEGLEKSGKFYPLPVTLNLPRQDNFPADNSAAGKTELFGSILGKLKQNQPEVNIANPPAPVVENPLSPFRERLDSSPALPLSSAEQLVLKNFAAWKTARFTLNLKAGQSGETKIELIRRGQSLYARLSSPDPVMQAVLQAGLGQLEASLQKLKTFPYEIHIITQKSKTAKKYKSGAIGRQM